MLTKLFHKTTHSIFMREHIMYLEKHREYINLKNFVTMNQSMNQLRLLNLEN